MIKELGGFRSGYDGAQDYDLFLRASAVTSGIAHIPKILYHWRDHEASTAKDVSRKEYADKAGIAALTDYLRSCHTDAYVMPGTVRTNYIVRYPIAGRPLVSIIIPFRDKVALLRKCVDSILTKTTYQEYELILISNRSCEPETFQYRTQQGKIRRSGFCRSDQHALLLMHGDDDDAVPWYQSIELYLALRRLGKDCIFLQYRSEPHHPRKYPNKLDYAIRMKEYFDHYLKGQAAPSWITQGVPYDGK